MTSAIQYQGRQARRLGSEQRRRAILEAALRIIVSEGVRNVRHRAVAREADVPLSATTYYFKDISDLICDAFTLFAETVMEDVIEPFRDQAFAVLERIKVGELADAAERTEILDLLADMSAAFVLDQVNNHRDQLVAEQAFMYEAVLDERLRGLALSYRRSHLQVLEEACRRIGSRNAAYDAEVLLTTFQSIEYLQLLEGGQADGAQIAARMRHILEMIANG